MRLVRLWRAGNGVRPGVGVAAQGNRPNESGTPNAGNRADLGNSAREEVGDLLGLRILRGGQPELHGEQVGRVEPEIDLAAAPRWLGFVFDPIMRMVFTHDVAKRLNALKRTVETTDLLRRMAAEYA